MGKAVAFLLAILFVLVTVIVLLVFNFERQLLTPDTYKHALTEQDFYTQFHTLVVEQMIVTAGYNPCLENVDICEGEQPGDNALNQLIDERMLASASPELIACYKKSLGEGEFDRLMDEQPIRDNSWFETIQYCRYPQETLTKLTPQLEIFLNGMIAGIPDQATLQLPVGENEASSRGGALAAEKASAAGEDSLGNLLRAIRMVRTGIRLVLLLPAVLLLLIWLLAVRSVKGWLRWWGIPILIAGLIGFLVDLALAPVTNWVIGAFILQKPPAGFSPNLLQASLAVARSVIRSLVPFLVVLIIPLSNLIRVSFSPLQILALLAALCLTAAYAVLLRQDERPEATIP